MLNAAIIGLGWWGKRLVRSVKGSSVIRFVRGVSLEPEQVKDFAAEMNFVLGTSYDDVLADPAIDAVVLATPHTKHCAQVEAAAAVRKHVFCEKPFALTASDARDAISDCESADVALGVGHHFRLMPSMTALHEVVASGELGTIMHVEGNYSHDWLAAQPADNWRSAPEETRAGGMTGMGIHVLDSFTYLAGPIRRVCAISKRRVLPIAAGDTTAALVVFASGATGTLATTLKTPFVWRIAVYGENAWAESVSETRLILCHAGKEPEVKDFQPNNHLGLNLESFANAALRRGTFHISPQGIQDTASALDGVFRSVDANGEWQEII
jgi:predicted dehydrogenase